METKAFIEYLVGLIIDEGTKVEVIETEEEGVRVYRIIVPIEQTGRIIGKGGKVVNALRTLIRLKAIKNQERVLIKIGND